MRIRRVLPDQADLDPVDALANLNLQALAPPDRPYVVANMVSSADGRATVGGRSGPLGTEADRAVFHSLRAQVDAVMAGTGTLRVERYGRIIREPEVRAARERAGLPGDALAVVVSRSGVLPLDIPLFAEPEQPVAIFVSAEPPPLDVDAQVTVTRLPAGASPLTAAFASLRSDFGVRALLCEGGPTVLGAMLEEDLVDELFLTLSPLLAGGAPAKHVVEGPPLSDAPIDLGLVELLESDDALFVRYRIKRPG